MFYLFPIKTLPLLLTTVLPLLGELPELDSPLSDFQVIGSHNSYHIAPMEAERALIRIRSEADVLSLEYTHPPLAEQFAAGIRQIELDCFSDPEGGAFANPLALQLAGLSGHPAVPQPDPQNLLNQPGTKVLHFPNFDFRTTVLTLTEALRETEGWSQANPNHFPILVLLELKGGAENWSFESLLELEKELLSVVKRGDLLIPDDVRGSHPDLRTAIAQSGWPRLRDARGKLILALDNTGQERTNYLGPDPLLQERLLFVSAPSEAHPSAAFFKINQPVANFAQIQALSAKGYLIRTRADADTREARANDTSRREKAFAAGAQFISSDFFQPNPAFSNYAVTLPKGAKEFYRFRISDKK